MRPVHHWFQMPLAAGALLAGCQFVSGVNDLEVAESESGGAGGTGGTGGTGGSVTQGSGGTDVGGAAGSTGTTSTSASGGSSTTGNSCTSRPNWECDVVSNCGCADGESCGYDSTLDGALCNPAGSQEPYDGCIDNLDCPVGHGCIGSACKKYCNEAEDCGWASASCLETYDGDVLIEGFGFCSAECNLVDPSSPDPGSMACGDDATCYPTVDDAGNLEHTLCVGTESDAGQDTPCLGVDGERDFLACGPGYFCSSLSNSCQKWCELADSDCATTATCIGFDPPLLVGDDELGTCFTCATGESECSTYPHCGCAAGEACNVTDIQTGAATCGVPGSAAINQRCMTADGCAQGACVSGVCRPYCQGEGTDTCTEGECLSAYNDTQPIPGFFYCDVPCEPVLSGQGAAGRLDCPEDLACLPVSTPSATTGAYCIVANSGAEGTSCEGVGHQACADGLGCINSVCAPWCRTNADCSVTYPYCALDLTNDYYVVSADEVGLCVASLL